MLRHHRVHCQVHILSNVEKNNKDSESGACNGDAFRSSSDIIPGRSVWTPKRVTG